jgi:hypothetical protein
MASRYLLGFDVGSSSVKASLTDVDNGEIVASAFYPDHEAPIIAVKTGWAEQDPQMWWDNAKLAFYSSHQEELARLKRIRKLHQKVATLITESALSDEEYGSDGREDFSRGVTKHPGDNRGFYHGVSPGESERGLMDYFYPEDTRTMFLRKEEQMLQHDKKNNKTSSTNKKQ